MNIALGATFNILFSTPRCADIIAKGINILNRSKAVIANGSKIGMRRVTESREKADKDATLPVPKKAAWMKKKKKRAMRLSERIKGLNSSCSEDFVVLVAVAGTTLSPFCSCFSCCGYRLF